MGLYPSTSLHYAKRWGVGVMQNIFPSLRISHNVHYIKNDPSENQNFKYVQSV